MKRLWTLLLAALLLAGGLPGKPVRAEEPEISIAVSGEELYLELKKRGILIRHFSKERIRDYNRITIGTPEQMDALIANIKDILEEKK